MPTDPLAVHRTHADEVLASGDPAAIKQLYVELGELWEDAHAGDLESIPVLSRTETHPVVAGLLEGVTGLMLDAGCGPRPALSILVGKTPGRVMVGMDMGIGTVRLARAVAGSQGVAFLGVVGDLEHLPFRNAAFDGGVCDDTIEHVPDDRRAASELARVLRPGGRMVLATPSRHSILVLKAKLLDTVRRRRQPDAAYFVSNSHLREYTWKEFVDLVAPVFHIRRRAGVGWDDAGWKRKQLNRFMGTRAGRGLGQMIVLEVERR